MNNSQNNQNVNQPIQMNVSQHPSHQTNQMMQQGHSNFVNQAPVQQTTVQQPQQNVQQPTAHMSTNPNATNQEMLNKTKKLISDLKESLANLMNLAAKNIEYNYQIDSGVKPQLTNVDKCPRFDKAWGEFNSICNQVETHFKTFQECSLLKKGSKTYVPFNLASFNQIDQNANDNSITYGQYVNLVKNQVNYSKQVQEILAEGARKISQMDIGLINQQQQNIHNQQQQQQQQQQHSYHPIQQSNMLINQHQVQTQHPYHTNQMQMSNQSPIANHQSPMMINQMNNQQISQQQMMHQQQPMQRGPTQLNNQLNNQMPIQQPILQQMHHSQINNQMTNQINNQMPQQMKPQQPFIPHNQMQ